MFEISKEIFCFVTVAVSFLYGTRVAWKCGRKCNFNEEPSNKMVILNESVPSAAFIYFFGFLILFSYLINGFLVIIVSSLTSAILISFLVVSMAMPELKSKPSQKKH